MNGFRPTPLFAVLIASTALAAAAQGTMVDPKAPATTTNAQPSTAKKADAKPAAKAAPKTAEKHAPPKKTAAKAPPKKVDSKAHATAQGGTVQKYEAGKAPELRDSKGNVVPTSPDAYDVSSATSPPPKKK